MGNSLIILILFTFSAHAHAKSGIESSPNTAWQNLSFYGMESGPRNELNKKYTTEVRRELSRSKGKTAHFFSDAEIKESLEKKDECLDPNFKENQNGLGPLNAEIWSLFSKDPVDTLTGILQVRAKSSCMKTAYRNPARGVFNGGLCWWHTLFEQRVWSLAIFAPKKNDQALMNSKNYSIVFIKEMKWWFFLDL